MSAARQTAFLCFGVAAMTLAVACGGGSSSSSGSGGSSSGSGSGSSGGSGSGSGGSTTPNTVAINVGPGPSSVNPYTNGVFVSVTVCTPGSSSQCVTIPDVLLDTGSTGLRVLASTVSSLSLTRVASGSGTLANCMQYVDLTYNWGTVALADVKMAGEAASAVPIQVIADSTSGLPAAPAGCSNGGTASNTVDSLGARGILGLSFFMQDCGSACAPGTRSNPGVYYNCTSSACQVTTAALGTQLQNPVGLFSSDSNGFSITLPTLGAAGAPSASGTLTFGIGTQSDNALGSATIQTTDGYGNFTTTYKSVAYSSSFIDSGSNANYFLDAKTTGLAACPQSTGFYCPTTLQNLTATNTGANGKAVTVNFRVTNADQLPAPNWAFDDIAGSSSSGFAGSGLPSLYFDWGLPFFFGRTVFVALEGHTAASTSGPFWAY